MPPFATPPRKLPTVELVHKKTGQTRVLNQTDYARDIGFWSRMWKVKSWRRGDAPDDEVLESKRESDLNKHRMEDPVEAKKRGDHDRAFEERSLKVAGDTDLGKALKATAQKPAEDWRKMPWFKKRAYVRDKTGTMPKNAAHAEELMQGK